MTLSISRGKELEIQLLDQVTNLDGQRQKIDGELKLTVKQSTLPTYEYPFISTQTKVNYCPRENQKLISDLPFLSLCRAGVSDEDPTCGWALDENGQRIPFSQGFCCKCNGIFSNPESSRSGASCGIFDFSSSAHCMRQSDLWFSVNTILPPRLNLDIIIEAEYNAQKAQITLSPTQPVAVLRKGLNGSPLSMAATVIGQLQASVLPPSLESNYALVPVQPADSPLVSRKNQYLALVPKNMVSLLGDECNKIGVSHATFSRQSERCNVAPSTCLRNQLCDLQLIDAQRVKENQKAQYFIGFDQNVEVRENNGQESLIYPITEGIQNTLVTVEVDAAQIRLVSNVSPGKLVNVVVHSFEAQSASGEMEITVENLGSLDTTKTITVVCSANVALVNPIQFRLKAQETTTKMVQILTRDSSAQTHSCDVKLFNEQNQIDDSVTVEFDTTDTVLVTPEKKAEEQNPEVTREHGTGGLDVGDLGGAFGDFLNGAFRSPLVLGSVVVVLIVMGVIAAGVILVLTCYCCLSTNSLPVFVSMFCAASRLTHSTMGKISSQNRHIAKKIQKSSKRKKRITKDVESSSDDSDRTVRKQKSGAVSNRNVSRKYAGAKLKRKHPSSESRVHGSKTSPIRKKRRITKESHGPKDSMRSPSPAKKGERKAPKALPPTPHDAPVEAALNAKTFPKLAPTYSENFPKVLHSQLGMWDVEDHLVYLSVHTNSIEFVKIFQHVVQQAPVSGWFALCGFVRLEGDVVNFEVDREASGGPRYALQWFGVQEGALIQYSQGVPLESTRIRLTTQMCKYAMHARYVRGPVLNMSSRLNFSIWEQREML